MGVHGLWQLLMIAGYPLTIQSLSGKVLAIDASIWLVRADSSSSQTLERQVCILRSIFRRIIKLLKYNIRPVFVFDGTPPSIKRQTLQKRRSLRRQIGACQENIRKRVQIQVMRVLQKNKKANQKPKISITMNQVNAILQNLSSVSQTYVTQKEQLQKMALQGEVLTQKYILLVDLYPQILSLFLSVQDFSALDLDSKMQILQDSQAYTMKLDHKKSQENNLTLQQQTLKTLQLMQKKSKIRTAQDQLYRQSCKKVEKEGYEIIQTIYHGKKVTQKRLINGNSKQNQKSKMRNNLNQILKAQIQQNDSQNQNDKKQDFFSSIFQGNPTYNNQSNTNSKRASNIVLQILKQDQKQNVIKQQQIQNDYIDQGQDNKKILKKLENKMQDPDDFPEFIHDEPIQYNQSIQQQFTNFQALLTLLNIPYIIAPSQAQAQCAQLQIGNIVDGIITQDSDVFLFGGCNIYRGVFQNRIQAYQNKSILDKLKLNRQKLIILALFLGSDYTQGVKGIGIVNAMEIVKIFSTFQSLAKFTKWAHLADSLNDKQSTTAQIIKNLNNEQQVHFFQFHQRYKNYWHINNSFPNNKVIDAYLNPQVIQCDQLQELKKTISQDSSQFIKQKQQQILQFLIKKFQMSEAESKDSFRALTKKFKRQNQLKIDQMNKKIPVKVNSKRLQKVIGLQNNNLSADIKK